MVVVVVQMVACLLDIVRMVVFLFESFFVENILSESNAIVVKVKFAPKQLLLLLLPLTLQQLNRPTLAARITLELLEAQIGE